MRPAWQRKGLAEALYRKLSADAHDMGCAVLTTHASHLARRFLERRGWHVTDTQNVERNGVRIPRFAMALLALDQGVKAT